MADLPVEGSAEAGSFTKKLFIDMNPDLLTSIPLHVQIVTVVLKHCGFISLLCIPIGHCTSAKNANDLNIRSFAAYWCKCDCLNLEVTANTTTLTTILTFHCNSGNQFNITVTQVTFEEKH